jgi:hypothetical protein
LHAGTYTGDKYMYNACRYMVYMEMPGDKYMYNACRYMVYMEMPGDKYMYNAYEGYGQ